MSLNALTWAFSQDLPCAKKFVLVALGDQANHDDECWPSQGYLAERCGLSRAYVNTILGELEAEGFIYISSRSRKNGGDTSNLYILAIPAGDAVPVAKGSAPSDVPGCVYVLSDGDRCKIGITRHLDRRVRNLESANGKTLKVVGVIECGMRTARNLERAAHEHFQEVRQKGEWFAVQGLVALQWLKAKAGEGVLTPLTPPVSAKKTPGVNGDDRGVSAQKTPISIEPSVSNPQEEPQAGGGDPQGDLLGAVPKPPTPAEILASAYEAYDAAALRAGWAAVQKRTDARDKHLRARMVDAGGLDGWRLALEKAEACAFLCGRAPPQPGKPPFFADFDFLTRESSFVKLMEGKYDNRQGAKSPDPGGSIGIAARVAARRAAERAGRNPAP